MKEGSLVAVYGSLRKGMGNHHILGNSKLVGTCEVHGWDMYSLGSFPCIVEGNNKVVIEVYEVDSDKTAVMLDCLEGYRGDSSGLYDRCEIETAFGKSWIYFMHSPRSVNHPVARGDWVRFKLSI